MSVGVRRSCRRRCAERCSSATADAASPAAIDPTHGATRTTSFTGPTVAATALSNLILLCRQHHRAIHAGRARLDMDDGLPVFRRPDGSRLDHPSHLSIDVPVPA